MNRLHTCSEVTVFIKFLKKLKLKRTHISVSIYQSPVAFDLSFTCVDKVRLQKHQWSKIKPKIDKSSIVPKLKYNFFLQNIMPRMTAFSERIKDEYQVDGRFQNSRRFAGVLWTC